MLIEFCSWWRHQMETFSALLAILCGEFTGARWIPHTKASDAELWCYFDLRPNKRLGKQSRGWWFETLSPPLWRHRNVSSKVSIQQFMHHRIDQIHNSHNALVFISRNTQLWIWNICSDVMYFGIWDACIAWFMRLGYWFRQWWINTPIF